MIDEYADCRPGTFDAHVRPALADRRGWLWLIGVPDVEGPAHPCRVGFARRAKPA